MDVVEEQDSSSCNAQPEAGDEGCLHRFNAHLPYKDSIRAENDRLLAEVAGALASFDAERDDPAQVLRACSGLNRMRDLKYTLDDASRLFLARALYALAFPTTGVSPLPWRCGQKVMSELTMLIGKKRGRLALVGRLVLPWRPMFVAVDGSSPRGFPLASSSNEKSRLVALLQLVGQASLYWAPGADREIWDEVKEEIVQVQTQGAFKALYLLCLFMPSRSDMYDELLPEWFSLWGQIDHCPSWDGAWLTLLDRASKHASHAFDWTPYMSDIYSLARASFHTPLSMGNAGSAPLPGSRHVAYQYQAIGPVASRSASAKLGKLGKMLVFLLGKGGPAALVRVSDVAIVPPAGGGTDGAHDGDGGNTQRAVSPGALQLLSLFRGLRTYFHPSNGGRWSLEMALMMNYVLSSLTARVGRETALRDAGRLPRNGELSRDDAGLVVDALLPLVLEMVYSKDPSVGSISNLCLLNLAALSPKTLAPAAAELILRALDPVASINHTHQAPAAIRALTAIFRPLMYPRPYLAPYLPALLELTLPGVDANDVFKTTITLQFYHMILCWVPVQGNTVSYSAGSLDGWKPSPLAWLDASSAHEATDADEDEHLYTACEGLGGVVLEWSVALVDRMFEVMRHKDKSSKAKVGDLASDTMNVAAAMTGVSSGRNGMGMTLFGAGGNEALLSGLIMVVTQQLFTMADAPAAEIASSKLLRFVTDKAIPNVEKDVATMVEMMAIAWPARAVATFFPALCDGLLASSTASSDRPAIASGTSSVLVRWRLRILSGLARGGGVALSPHGPTLRRLIAAGINHADKRVRKGARKLLRKALQGLCEIYPADTRCLPPARWANVNSVAEWRRLCEPVPVGEHNPVWVEPSPQGLVLAAELLEDFVTQPTKELLLELSRAHAEKDGTAGAAATAAGVWRENLKTMDYAIRGGSCLLADRETPGEDDGCTDEHLRDDVYLAVGSQGLSRLLSAVAGTEGPRLYGLVAGMRAETARFLVAALEACAQGNGPTDVKAAKLAVGLSVRVACTRGAQAHQTRRQGLVLMSFKSHLRDPVAFAAGKMRLTLALEAAANGDTGPVIDARRDLLRVGVGGGRSWPRALVVVRAFLQHWKRLARAPRAIAYAARNAAGFTKYKDADAPAWAAASAVLDRYRSLFSALVQLSSSEYAMVRAAAQVGVNRVGGVYPWFARGAVPELISRLSPSGEEDVKSDGGDAAHRRLTGACYLLHQRRSMRHVASEWRLLRALLLALCDSQSVLARLSLDKQEKAAARVTILFTSYVSCWRANPLVTDKDKAEYALLVDGLLDRLAAFSGAATSAGGGWRYQLMVSWCLMHLIRPSGALARNSEGLVHQNDGGATATLPMAVWRWFARCLSEGDGQPLQSLAIGALKRLLASIDPTSPAGGEVSGLLCSRAFLRPFFLALAHNHKKQATEGGVAGTDQWSLGVKEILHDSARGDMTRELFPRLRFSMRSRLFWARNARLVSAVVSAVSAECRGDCIRILVEETTAAKASVAHEDKRSFDCAAAEVGAGVMAVLAGENSWSAGHVVLRETVLPFIETELEGGSLDGRLDWTDAIRFALDHSTVKGCEPLVSRVVERTIAVLHGGGKGRDDFSVLVKWLSFTGAVLIELSGREASASRADDIARELCPLLVEGLDHPFKACREEIARNLFLVTNATDIAWAASVADGVRESVLAEAAAVEEESGRNGGGGEQDVANGMATLSVTDAPSKAEDADSALLANALVMSDGAPTKEQQAAATRAAKRLSLRRETVLQWLHQTVVSGDHSRCLPVFVALLPVALECVRDSSVEVAAMGRGVCLSTAAALTTRSPKGADLSDTSDADTAVPGTMGGVMNAVISEALSSSSWRARRNAAAVACILQTRLNFVLTLAQHRAADAALLSLLGDNRREVQETACLAVSTRLAHLTAAETRVLCEKFSAGADSVAASRKKRRKIAKRQAAAAASAAATSATRTATVAVAAGEPSGELKEQQTSVLGLSAVVLAAPCDVPPWVPGALESLAKHVNDETPGRLPVRQTVTHTFKEFRRTHQDKWEESHKARFSLDQLDTFSEVLGGAHSYFI